ncbi:MULTISPECIES: OmpA family protein [unclassified Sphingomonas]|uniref:OmpA family protein n=1 Tax=unclassified Sphingomonas TaxID=196159 RepID=UPI002859812D|nr:MULTISPECIES: OmpA family protein [unclassified Sphingomonas]MDR6116069.1 outer membrane protein OmpA-like peptidoglycan-associated protein [Sphingomonas sp. SORGH_AS_0789]MDR6150258.1 outer membrane protein OmpA-like peptidoglycan-associated protein [Sphingomonas sp. SORGH_AS_0742]
MTTKRLNERAAQSLAAMTLALGIAACQPAGPAPANDTTQAEPVANTASPDNSAMANEQVETKSIIRPDIEPAPTPSPTPEPIDLTIAFPAKGAKPDDKGLAQIDALIADPVFGMGGAITIWGHSDSHGSDASNLIASRRRAEAVRDYLVEKGTAADRITVIAMGEANPVAPNRKPDGSDDPEGRDRNRRVEIKVDLPPKPAEPIPATPS